MYTKKSCSHRIEPAQGRLHELQAVGWEGWDYPWPLELSVSYCEVQMLDMEPQRGSLWPGLYLLSFSSSLFQCNIICWEYRTWVLILQQLTVKRLL